MSGADQCTSERALENRRKATLEGLLLKQRYNRYKDTILYKIVTMITTSLVDKIIAWRYELKYKGKRYDQF